MTTERYRSIFQKTIKDWYVQGLFFGGSSDRKTVFQIDQSSVKDWVKHAIPELRRYTGSRLKRVRLQRVPCYCEHFSLSEKNTFH